jgi:hypothetical protein
VITRFKCTNVICHRTFVILLRGKNITHVLKHYKAWRNTITRYGHRIMLRWLNNSPLPNSKFCHRPDDGASEAPLKRWLISTRLHGATSLKKSSSRPHVAAKIGEQWGTYWHANFISHVNDPVHAAQHKARSWQCNARTYLARRNKLSDIQISTVEDLCHVAWILTHLCFVQPGVPKAGEYLSHIFTSVQSAEEPM